MLNVIILLDCQLKWILIILYQWLVSSFGISQVLAEKICCLTDLFVVCISDILTLMYILGSPGASRIENCLLCPSGYFCDQKGLTEPSGLCSEGYYCPVGQNTSKPPEHKCRAGHFCEEVKTLQLINRFRIHNIPCIYCH